MSREFMIIINAIGISIKNVEVLLSERQSKNNELLAKQQIYDESQKRFQAQLTELQNKKKDVEEKYEELIELLSPPTSITLCNHTATKIWVTLISHQGNYKGWVATGWYQVNTKSCEEVNVGDIDSNEVIIYAKGENGKLFSVQFFDAEDAFCINQSDAFSIENSDKKSNCYGDNLEFLSIKDNMAIGTFTKKQNRIDFGREE